MEFATASDKHPIGRDIYRQESVSSEPLLSYKSENTLRSLSFTVYTPFEIMTIGGTVITSSALPLSSLSNVIGSILVKIWLSLKLSGAYAETSTFWNVLERYKSFVSGCYLLHCYQKLHYEASVNLQKQSDFHEKRPQASIRQGTVLLMPAKKKQADYREVDESLSEFEWARRVSKTWDMGQD